LTEDILYLKEVDMVEESKSKVEPGKTPTGSDPLKTDKDKAGSQTDVIALSKALSKLRAENKDLKEQLVEKGESETSDAGKGDLFGDGSELLQKELGRLKVAVKAKETDIRRLTLDNKALKAAQKYGVPVEALEGEENPEAKVLEILAEVAEKEAQAEKEKAESGEEGKKIIYDTGIVSTEGRKMPKDMTDEEFAEYARKEEQKYNETH